MEASDFTAPKLKAVEVMEEGVWAATDVAGAMNGITIMSVSSHIQWPNRQCFTNLDKYSAHIQSTNRKKDI